MKYNEMIERYIYAVTKNLTPKTRSDVAKELHSIISDMLDERCGDVLPTEHDVRVVLTELGKPAELSEKYNPDGGKYLIGGLYYTKYKLVLKIVLISVAFGMSLAGIITTIMEQNIWYIALSQWFGIVFSGLTFAFAFVTILFSFFYHKGIKIDTQSDSPDDLPPVPNEKTTISRWQPILGIVISVVFVVVFLVAPQIFCVLFTENGEFITVFNLETIRSTWYLIIFFAVLGIIRESVKLIDGRYTRRVMTVSIVTDLLSAALSFWWLMNKKIINPEFVRRMTELFIGEDEAIGRVFANFQYLFLGVIVFALVLDVITAIIKSLKYAENSENGIMHA